MEILLLHPGGIGDIILALPAIALLRKKFPDARLTIAGNIDHLAPITGTYVDGAVSLSTLPLHNLYADRELPQQDVNFWKSFGLIFSWTGSGDPGFVRKLKSIKPDACISSWKPDPQDQRHVSQLFVDSLGPEIAEGTIANPVPVLPDSGLSSQGVQWLSRRGWNGDSLMALHPGAGSKTKRWPLERFIRLARSLAPDEKKKLLIIEGPAESGLAAGVARELSVANIICAESLPLDLLAAIMARSRLFVGNDSGIAHLSASLGVPSVVLFGPTLPQHWAPLGPKVRVLRYSRGCKACSSGGDGHTCLENITVDNVIREIRDCQTNENW